MNLAFSTDYRRLWPGGPAKPPRHPFAVARTNSEQQLARLSRKMSILRKAARGVGRVQTITGAGRTETMPSSEPIHQGRRPLWRSHGDCGGGPRRAAPAIGAAIKESVLDKLGSVRRMGSGGPGLQLQANNPNSRPDRLIEALKACPTTGQYRRVEETVKIANRLKLEFSHGLLRRDPNFSADQYPQSPRGSFPRPSCALRPLDARLRGHDNVRRCEFTNGVRGRRNPLKRLDLRKERAWIFLPMAWIFLPKAWIFLPRFAPKENSAAPRNSMNNNVNSTFCECRRAQGRA